MEDQNSGPGPVPDRWLNCPRKSTKLIANTFIAFKTPLDNRYRDQLPASSLFDLSMLFASMKSYKVKLGLWIDLTNTSRFYNKEDVESKGCKYIKLQCRGHGETPSTEQTQFFVKLCSKYINQHPLDIIGVHCTHGFNRTGFMLVAFMVEILDMSLDAALREFSISRPPGIYKQDYIEELYKRYDDIADMIPAPERPDWCFEADDDKDDNEPTSSESSCDKRRKRKEFRAKNPVFMEGVGGVSVVIEPDLARIQRRCQDMCGWRNTGFPGSQPVSMDNNNIELLAEKPYRVSWKADGTRYMMLIDSDGAVYFIDRDNSVFKVSGIHFFKSYPEQQVRTSLDGSKSFKFEPLVNTLFDGEMVIDIVKGEPQPRYLVYDIIKHWNQSEYKRPFYPDRYNLIEKVVNPRRVAIDKKIIARGPFSIRRKDFYDVEFAEKLLSDKFAKNLPHELDGLIFQPAEEPYKCGPCDDCLKWKPSTLNSIDFKLKVVMETGQGLLSKKVGHLYVGGHDRPLATMKLTKSLKELDNKIIECKFENGQWVFMRERTDKSFPNGYNTAVAVWKSITDPVSENILLEFIRDRRYRSSEHKPADADCMPPPSKIPRR